MWVSCEITRRARFPPFPRTFTGTTGIGVWRTPDDCSGCPPSPQLSRVDFRSFFRDIIMEAFNESGPVMQARQETIVFRNHHGAPLTSSLIRVYGDVIDTCDLTSSLFRVYGDVIDTRMSAVPAIECRFDGYRVAGWRSGTFSGDSETNPMQSASKAQ